MIGSGTVELMLSPVPARPSYYAATDPAGRVLVRASRQPLFDAARALAAEGMPADTVIAARHRGSAIVAMRSTVGEAAKWRIEEKDRGGLHKRPWVPFETARLFAQGVPENGGGPVPMDDQPPAGQRQPVPAIAAWLAPASGNEVPI